MQNKRHIISLLLQNEVGALNRVAGLFSARGYNIESLNVAATDDPTVSRLTLVTQGTDAVVAQIVNQSLKLVDVVHVDDMTRDQHIERELLLLKLRPHSTELEALNKLIEHTGAQVLSTDPNSYLIELTASEAKVGHFIRSASAHGTVLEVVRSGALAILHATDTTPT